MKHHKYYHTIRSLFPTTRAMSTRQLSKVPCESSPVWDDNGQTCNHDCTCSICKIWFKQIPYNIRIYLLLWINNHIQSYSYTFALSPCIFKLQSYLSQSAVNVEIVGYTHNSTLTSGDSVPLGTQIILVCRVVGLPYGTPLSYTWSCPNGPCEVEGYYGRKVYNEHILAVNTTSTSDRGTYTCQVTATGGHGDNGSFSLTVTGKSCVCCITD